MIKTAAYESIEECIPDWLWSSKTHLILILDQNGYPVLLNESLRNLLRKKVQLHQDSIQQIIRYPNANAEDILTLLEKGKDKKYAFGLRTGINGSESMVWTDWEFIKVMVGGQAYFIGDGVQSRDIDLIDERIMHRSISRAILDGSILSVTDAEGRILSVNQNFIKFTDFTKEEVLGKRHNDILIDLETKSFWRTMLATIKNGNIWSDDVPIRIRNGETRWLNTIVSPVKDVIGNIDRIIYIQFDVSEYRKLLKHKEALSEIAFIQSHEFRRPVANMLGILDLLNADPQMKNVPSNINLLIDMLRQSVRDTDEIIAKIVSKTVDNAEFVNEFIGDKTH